MNVIQVLQLYIATFRAWFTLKQKFPSQFYEENVWMFLLLQSQLGVLWTLSKMFDSAVNTLLLDMKMKKGYSAKFPQTLSTITFIAYRNTETSSTTYVFLLPIQHWSKHVRSQYNTTYMTRIWLEYDSNKSKFCVSFIKSKKTWLTVFSFSIYAKNTSLMLDIISSVTNILDIQQNLRRIKYSARDCSPWYY